MKKNQAGVGLVEVLVSLVLLAIAVLGFTAMQLRAVTSSIEASNNVQATTLARDLGERMRINREGITSYTGTPPATASTNCNTTFCTPAQLATFDYAQIGRKATDLGMSVAVNDCPNTQLSRTCIFVAWEETTPTIGSGENDCVAANATYNSGARCVMVEAYNK